LFFFEISHFAIATFEMTRRWHVGKCGGGKPVPNAVRNLTLPPPLLLLILCECRSFRRSRAEEESRKY